LPLPRDVQQLKPFQLFATLTPHQTPLGALPPDPRYRLALRARHGLQPSDSKSWLRPRIALYKCTFTIPYHILGSYPLREWAVLGEAREDSMSDRCNVPPHECTAFTAASGDRCAAVMRPLAKLRWTLVKSKQPSVDEFQKITRQT